MEIDKDLILKLEKLARLQLSETERTQLTGDLNNILKMVSKLEELDTDNIKPLIYVSDEINRLRADEVKNQVSKVEALKNAPDKDENYFKVPNMMKK